MNNDKRRCEGKITKGHNACQKGYIWNPATCNRENKKWKVSIISNSVPLMKQNLFHQNQFENRSNKFKLKVKTYKAKHYYVLIGFFLINVLLL